MGGRELNRKEIDVMLKRAGWIIIHGSNHDLAIGPEGQRIALPRHRGDIKKGTVHNILRCAGLEYKEKSK